MPPDFAEATRWYRLAADQGLADAQVKLGVIYTGGRGMRQDRIEAQMWLTLGLSSGGSVEARGMFLKVLDTLAEQMTADQLAEAQRRAREWTPTPEP